MIPRDLFFKQLRIYVHVKLISFFKNHGHTLMEFPFNILTADNHETLNNGR